MSPPFLPERLRPRVIRRPVPGVAVISLLLLVVPAVAMGWWRIRAVDVIACEGLPDAVTASLAGLVGSFPLTVSPQSIRRQLEVWPAVAAVDVRLELPATLRVQATRAEVRGSVPVGRRWRAVTLTGTLAGPLDAPLPPVLTGFDHRAAQLAEALAVARRLERASGGAVRGVRRVAATDFEIELDPASGDRIVRLHVQRTETEGERWVCRQLARGAWRAAWADVRWDDRVVVGGVG